MPLNIVFLRPQNWSRLKPYYYSTTTAVKVFYFPANFFVFSGFGPLSILCQGRPGSRASRQMAAPIALWWPTKAAAFASAEAADPTIDARACTVQKEHA